MFYPLYAFNQSRARHGIGITNKAPKHIGNNFIRVNIIPFSKNFYNPYLINSFYESSLFDFKNVKWQSFSIEYTGFPFFQADPDSA